MNKKNNQTIWIYQYKNSQVGTGWEREKKRDSEKGKKINDLQQTEFIHKKNIAKQMEGCWKGDFSIYSVCVCVCKCEGNNEVLMIEIKF